VGGTARGYKKEDRNITKGLERLSPSTPQKLFQIFKKVLRGENHRRTEDLEALVTLWERKTMAKTVMRKESLRTHRRHRQKATEKEGSQSTSVTGRSSETLRKEKVSFLEGDKWTYGRVQVGY